MLFNEKSDIILDGLTIFILRSILDTHRKRKGITTWEIAKAFKWEECKPFLDKTEESRFYSSKTMTIKSRLDKMAKMGLIIKEGKQKENYIVCATPYKNQDLSKTECMKLIIKDNYNRWWIVLEM